MYVIRNYMTFFRSNRVENANKCNKGIEKLIKVTRTKSIYLATLITHRNKTKLCDKNYASDLLECLLSLNYGISYV